MFYAGMMHACVVWRNKDAVAKRAKLNTSMANTIQQA